MWRELIRKVGVKDVAAAMGISAMAVNKYAQGKALPSPSEQSGAMMRRLCDVMFRRLSQEDFEAFLSSLAREITGFDVTVSGGSSMSNASDVTG
jgi:transcriptional regulator with XRE-family HTH domain